MTPVLTPEYDYMGRRIRKTAKDGNQTVITDEKFCYDGWNLLAVLNGTNNNRIKSFLWGLDLSGSQQGAGGVGGLLGVSTATAGNHFVCYDGNGNVMKLVSTNGTTITANYEYSPFGDVVLATGTAATANPFRFSTKYQDSETGLFYYGHRYYIPGTGRWLSRDPLGTGLDLDETLVKSQAQMLLLAAARQEDSAYVAFQNSGANFIDALGLSACKSHRYTSNDGEMSLGDFGFGGITWGIKVQFQRRVTVTTCEKCCSNGARGQDITTTIDGRGTVEASTPSMFFPVGPVIVRVNGFVGGSGGANILTRFDTCTKGVTLTSCYFWSVRGGVQGCVGAPAILEVCVRCEGNYTRRWCADGTSSGGCASARCMARFKTLFRTYDYVFWQTQPCNSGDTN